MICGGGIVQTETMPAFLIDVQFCLHLIGMQVLVEIITILWVYGVIITRMDKECRGCILCHL